MLPACASATKMGTPAILGLEQQYSRKGSHQLDFLPFTLQRLSKGACNEIFSLSHVGFNFGAQLLPDVVGKKFILCLIRMRFSLFLTSYRLER